MSWLFIVFRRAFQARVGVSVVCNSRLNLNQTQGPSSANHAPFHLPCSKNWRKPTLLESLDASGPLRHSMIGELPSFQWEAAQTSNKPALRVWGDYSVTVNPQLETHRHPLSLPEELMRRLGGGYGFTKIDLADAYNQVRLGPQSREGSRWALIAEFYLRTCFLSESVPSLVISSK